MRNRFTGIFPIAILLTVLLSSCYDIKHIISIKSGGLDSVALSKHALPIDYIKGNETFLSYKKDDSIIINPSNSIEFSLYATESVKNTKTAKVKHESHREKRERRKKEKAVRRTKPPHEKISHREKHRRIKAARKAAKEKYRAARVKRETCHEKHARHRSEEIAWKATHPNQKFSHRERHRLTKIHRKAVKEARIRHKHVNYKTSYAIAKMSKYYYRYVPMNGVDDFFISFFALAYPPMFANMLPVHERKILTEQECYGVNNGKGASYSRRILLEASVSCKNGKISEPINIWEDLPDEITMNSYIVKIRHGKRQVGSVTHLQGIKNGKLYHNFIITPRKGAFTKNTRVWVIMDVMVKPVP